MLPALQGKHIFEKRTQNEILTIVLDFAVTKRVVVAYHL